MTNKRAAVSRVRALHGGAIDDTEIARDATHVLGEGGKSLSVQLDFSAQRSTINHLCSSKLRKRYAHLLSQIFFFSPCIFPLLRCFFGQVYSSPLHSTLLVSYINSQKAPGLKTSSSGLRAHFSSPSSRARISTSSTL